MRGNIFKFVVRRLFIKKNNYITGVLLIFVLLFSSFVSAEYTLNDTYTFNVSSSNTLLGYDGANLILNLQNNYNFSHVNPTNFSIMSYSNVPATYSSLSSGEPSFYSSSDNGVTYLYIGESNDILSISPPYEKSYYLLTGNTVTVANGIASPYHFVGGVYTEGYNLLNFYDSSFNSNLGFGASSYNDTGFGSHICVYTNQFAQRFIDLGKPLLAGETFTNIINDYTTNRVYFKKGNTWFSLGFITGSAFNDCNSLANNTTLIIISQPPITNYQDYNNIIITSGGVYGVRNTSGHVIVGYSANINYSGYACKSDYSTCYDKTSICMDNFGSLTDGSTVCNNVTYYFGTACQEELNICSGGCTNVLLTDNNNVEYYHGVCSVGTCTNECYINGLRYSDTLQSYKTCGNYDTDFCLEYNTTVCNIGEYSINGICKNQTYASETLSKINFIATPYTSLNVLGGVYTCPNVSCTYTNGVWNCPQDECSVNNGTNNNLYSVSYNNLNNKLDVVTKNSNGNIGLFSLALKINGVNTSDIIGVDCRYSSVIEEASLNQTLNLNGLNTHIINTNTTFHTENLDTNNKEILIIMLNNSNTVFGLDINDGAKKISVLYFNISRTNNEYSVRKNNLTGNLLYTNTFSNSEIISKIKIDLYQDFGNIEQNSMITLYNSNGQIINNIGVKMQLYDDATATTPYNININPVTTVYLNRITREAIKSMPETYKQVYVSQLTDFIGNYDTIGCNYLTDGTYTARVYLSHAFLSDYFSYQDIFITKTSTTQEGTTNDNAFSLALTPTMKIILGFVIPLAVFLFILAFGITRNDESEKRILIYVACFVFFAGLLIFTIVEWIPILITILAVILASASIGLFFVRKSQGD